jgi:hypothetical protein
MDRTTLVTAFQRSLSSIDAPRLFQTERGYQGELLVQLSRHLASPNEAIGEQEYQKRVSEHGVTLRPDIIIHEPFDPRRHRDRTEGNHAVVELKLRANSVEAYGDFRNLETMLTKLHYELGVFINIGSSCTHSDQVPPQIRGRIVIFAIALVDGIPNIIEEHP